MTLTITLWLLVAAFVAFFIYSHYLEPRRLELSRMKLSISRLPGALEGLRIVHLSDLHVSPRRGSFSEHLARRAVALAVAEAPDMICLTGDLSQASRSVDLSAEILSPLAAFPVFVVMGNHDHDKMLETAALPPALRVPAEQWQQVVTRAGMTVLQNRHITIEVRGRRIVVAGCGDPSCGWDDLPRALAGQPQGDLHLLLAHSPDIMDHPLSDWADLVLCGHTHGGQFKLPGLGTPWAPVWRDRRRAEGLFRVGRALCHVSRGVAAGFRSRFLCPPHLSLLQITRQADGVVRNLPRYQVDFDDVADEPPALLTAAARKERSTS